MTDGIIALLGPEEDPWCVSRDDPKRQAIASLRGYAYQLHQSLAAWIALPEDATLHLEIAEDYATVVRDPATLEAALEATRVNPGRAVRLLFPTTSPISRTDRPAR